MLAARAFELEIAGTILPAISFILKTVSIAIENVAALRLVAALTNYKERGSSLEKVS